MRVWPWISGLLVAIKMFREASHLLEKNHDHWVEYVKNNSTLSMVFVFMVGMSTNFIVISFLQEKAYNAELALVTLEVILINITVYDVKWGIMVHLVRIVVLIFVIIFSTAVESPLAVELMATGLTLASWTSTKIEEPRRIMTVQELVFTVPYALYFFSFYIFHGKMWLVVRMFTCVCVCVCD